MNASRAELVLDRLVEIVAGRLPDWIGEDYLRGFVARNRAALVEAVAGVLAQLAARQASPRAQVDAAPDVPAGTPETWSTSQRTAVNLGAMALLADVEATGKRLAPSERRVVEGYSGWGGLSIRKVADQFPPGFPVPEARGLVHEYYTPERVWKAVADLLRPLASRLLEEGKAIRALEPSAGIGRALRAWRAASWPPVQWTAVEASQVSYRLLRATTDAKVQPGFFESFVAELPDEARFDLVVSNPPYGPRGEAMEQDPHPAYQTRRAYLYFIARGLDLLRPGGIGAYIVPTGFLTGSSPEMRRARERVLRRHHLLGAFRLPSVPPEGGTVADVVYEQFVVDLLVFEARGGTLARVPPSDQGVLDGGYYREHPDHVLGTPMGKDSDGWEPGQPVARRGFQLQGRFDGFPPWFPRPMAVGELAEDQTAKTFKARGGIAREDRAEAVGELPEDLDQAVRLGLRVDRYLAAVAKADPAAASAWPELNRDLLAWRNRHGDPLVRPGLRELAARRVVGAQRFLSAWTPAGLTAGLVKAPELPEQGYTGPWTDTAVVDWLYRRNGGQLTITQLTEFYAEHRQKPALEIVKDLTRAGWCLDGAGYTEIVSAEHYYTGLLWPKLDRAVAVAQAGGGLAAIAQAQATRLREAIGWRTGPSILTELLPIDSWLPLDLVQEWLSSLIPLERVQIERRDGLLVPAGLVEGGYHLLSNTQKHRTRGMHEEFLSWLGWANIDKGLWKPPREKRPDPETGEDKLEPVEEARAKQVAGWREHFEKWMQDDPTRLDRIEEAYNRQLRGYIPPVWPTTPVDVARWSPTIRLHDYQNQGLHMLESNGAGLLAFDVGLGKTYTGLKLLARLRQTGQARRPVVVVPNSIVWKWKRDFERVLPDYRVLVIGSTRSLATRGTKKGRIVATPDTPEERARKWSAFQAGEADAVLLTFSALARTQMDPAFVQSYVAKTISLRRSIVMDLEKADALKASLDAEGKKKGTKRPAPSERKVADMEERVRAWVATMLAPPKGWVYDPGIEWHSLGIDYLMVDEAQNFKNLLFSEREGAERQAAKRSWALDFRCASVRQHTGGRGVFLLSATPAKNSPTEFYNLLHLVRPEIWHQVAVDNHEAFLTRYGRFEQRQVLSPDGQKIHERDVVVGFKNTDELRDVVYRWSSFKVAEDVGLKLPSVDVRQHKVSVTPAMTARLHEAFRELADIEEEIRKVASRAKESAAAAGRMRMLQMRKQGIALRIYALYLHPELPGIGTDKAAVLRRDANEAPKLVECAKEILATSEQVCPRPGEKERWCLDCGHVVFADNIAVHYWMRQLLIDQGIAPERIATLNAVEASDTEMRQQIVEAFNGVGAPGDDDYSPPSLDVVIANAIAYEGVDLQRRTCAIHHLDVPWEPATLQQRNGRGVRQGNNFEKVTIHYYFVDGSNEGWKIQRIERKRGWMAELVEGQRRRTNTTTEEELSEDQAADIALAHAPPDVRARIMEARKEQAQQAKADKVASARKAANKDLSYAASLWSRLARNRNPDRVAGLRQEAQEALAKALRYPADLWPGLPWHSQAQRVTEGPTFIPLSGLPLHPGDWISMSGFTYEVGQLGEQKSTTYKRSGSTAKSSTELLRGVWVRRTGNDLAAMLLSDTDERTVTLTPAPDDDRVPESSIRQRYLTTPLSLPGQWRAQLWDRLAPATQERWWSLIAADWQTVDLRRGAMYGSSPFFSAERDGVLVLLHNDGARTLPTGARLLPPTEAGWQRYQALAEGSDETWTLLNATADFWWSRKFPRRASASTTAAEAA